MELKTIPHGSLQIILVTTIKSGQNKIPAKYSCIPNSDSSNTQHNFVKYRSVNVTGI